MSNKSVGLASSYAAPAEHRSPSAAREPEVSGILICALADVLQQRGITPERLMAGQDLGEGRELFGARIPLRQYHALFARAIALTDDPALGLSCGSQAREASFDLLGPLVAHAQSLRHAIALMQQFQALLVDDVRVRFEERSGIALLRCEFPRTQGPLDGVFAELQAAGLVRMLETFGCARTDLRAVRFEHARPPHHRAYAAAFGGAERFSQPFTGVEFVSTVLDRPNLHRDPELQTLLHGQAQRRLERLSRPATFVERLRGMLRSQPCARPPDMTTAARGLGISVRSLRRRLTDEGASYRAITESVLEESACTLLRNPELSVQAISHELGFSDATAFHRAFKRWTGVTPVAYRAQPIGVGSRTCAAKP